MAGSTDLVGMIESAYRLDLDDDDWLRGLVLAARPHLDCGQGVYGFRFDASLPARFRIWGMVVGEDAVVIPELIERWHDALQPEQVWRMYRGPKQFASISERLGVEQADDEPYEQAMNRFCRRIGIVDQLTLRGVDPSYRGITICTPLTSAARSTELDATLWTRLAAHLASGCRLRRLLADEAKGTAAGGNLTDGAEAICAPDGRVVHASGLATDPEAQSELRRAVVAIDRARSRMRREDPEGAVDVWQGLVSGTWSLVEHFESDGRRYMVARRNSPGAVEPKSLTQRECQAIHYVALGHSTKETAYALGISDVTVSGHLAAAMKKLGVRTRAELIQLMTWPGPNGIPVSH